MSKNNFLLPTEHLAAKVRNDRPILFMPKMAFLGPQMICLETLYLLTLFLLLNYLLLQVKFTVVRLWMEKNHLQSLSAIPSWAISVWRFRNWFFHNFRRNLSTACLWFFWPPYTKSWKFSCFWGSRVGPLHLAGIFVYGAKAFFI